MSKPDGVILEPYSDKSFVLRGDTRQYKEDIKRLGGTWGPNLKDGAAWLFPKSKQDIVGKWLDTGDISDENIQYRSKSLEEQVKNLTTQVYELQKNVSKILDLLKIVVEKKTNEEYNTNIDDDNDNEEVKPARLLGGKK